MGASVQELEAVARYAKGAERQADAPTCLLLRRDPTVTAEEIRQAMEPQPGDPFDVRPTALDMLAPMG